MQTIQLTRAAGWEGANIYALILGLHPEWMATVNRGPGLGISVEYDFTAKTIGSVLTITVPDGADLDAIREAILTQYPDTVRLRDADAIRAARAEVLAMLGWGTNTADAAQGTIRNFIFGGQTIEQISATIDATVTNTATARTALKSIASEVVHCRAILVEVAKILVHLRDVAVS